MKTGNLVLAALCAAITCILAPISLPIGPVPISLATFAVMLAGALLGPTLGTISQLVYLLLGAVGVPVFAGYTAGVQNIAGPTGGYLVGYLPLTFLVGLIYFRTGRGKSGAVRTLSLVLSMIAGTAVLYALGTVWFCLVMQMSVGKALGLCVLPFLPGDALKILAVTLITPPIEAAIRRTGAQSVGSDD